MDESVKEMMLKLDEFFNRKDMDVPQRISFLESLKSLYVNANMYDGVDLPDYIEQLLASDEEFDDSDDLLASDEEFDDSDDEIEDDDNVTDDLDEVKDEHPTEQPIEQAKPPTITPINMPHDRQKIQIKKPLLKVKQEDIDKGLV